MVEIYSSGDPGLVLDDEFTKFLPPLTEEERAQLAEDIKVHGCLSPLIVWRNGDGSDYLLDGYHRYEICQENLIPFKVQRISGITTRSEALGWMLRHQTGRRNLGQVQRLRIASELRETLEKEARERKLSGKTQSNGEDVAEDVEAHGRGYVDDRVGALAGVSAEQVRRFRMVEKHATPEELADLEAGKLTINRLYHKYNPSPKKSAERTESTPPVAPEPEPAAPETQAAPSSDSESWLESLPLASKLSGRQLEIFKKDAQDYLYFEELRKKLGDVARSRFKKGGGKGPWAYALMRFLKCEHPKDWILCPPPEHRGCSGKGSYEFGECPYCHGAGYWIKGTYVLSTKA